MNIEAIVYRTLKDDGCTYSPLEDHIFLPGSPYYALSLHKECEEIIPLSDFSVDKLWEYIAKHKDKFDEGLCLGTWLYAGKVYLDITQLFYKEYFTLHEVVAKSKDQLAAWDLETSRLISLNYET